MRVLYNQQPTRETQKHTCDTQQYTCDTQQSICDTHQYTCNTQQPICDIQQQQLARDIEQQQLTCDIQQQQSTCDTKRSTCDIQKQPDHDTQHPTSATPLTCNSDLSTIPTHGHLAPPILNHIACLNSNVRSLRSQHVRDEVHSLAISHNLSIICITETWFQPDLQDSEIQLPGYDAYRKDRTNGQRGGGVVLYISNLINTSPAPCHHTPTTSTNYTGLDLTAALCSFDSYLLLVAALYRSPSFNNFDNVCTAINQLTSLASSKGASLLLLGDFNAPGVTWSKPPYAHNPQSEDFINCLLENNLQQAVNSPTRPGHGSDSILDLVLCDDDRLILDTSVLPPIGQSDHYTILCRLQLPTPCTQLLSPKPNYYTGDYVNFSHFLNQNNWSQLFSDKSASHCWDILYDKISAGAQQFIPFKTIPSNLKPIFPRHIRAAATKKHTAWRAFMNHKNSNTQILSIFRKAYNKARNRLTTLIRAHRQTQQDSLASSIRSNPKIFFRYINSKRTHSHALRHLETPTGSITTDPDKIVNILNDQFYNNFNLHSYHIPMTSLPSNTAADLLSSFNISKSTVLRELQSLNSNKASGPDSLHPHLLKSLATSLSLPLTIIFTRSCNTGDIPPIWKEAIVTPIPKPGDKSKPCNYRPISLTCHVVKILEKIIKGQISLFLERKNFFSNAQHGFLPKRSCTTNLLTTTNYWKLSLDNGIPIDTIYIDLSKAFDSVPHNLLFYKLNSAGISGLALTWLQNFLVGRTQRVVYQGHTSTPSPVASGVPQGCVLAPLLFVIYINELPQVTKHSNPSLFADDLKLSISLSYPSAHNDMQQDIQSISDWLTSWGLTINSGKSATFHLGHKNPKATFTISGSPIPASDCPRDLGIIHDPGLKYSQHCSSIQKKVNMFIGLTKRSFRNPSNLIISTIYKTFILPYINFASIIWSPRLKKDQLKLNALANRLTKLSKHRNLSPSIRLQKLNLPLPTDILQTNDILLLWDLLNERYSVDFSKLFTLASQNPTRGHQYKLFKHQATSTTTLHHFTNRVINTWNSIPQDIFDNSLTRKNFKHNITLWLNKPAP